MSENNKKNVGNIPLYAVICFTVITSYTLNFFKVIKLKEIYMGKSTTEIIIGYIVISWILSILMNAKKK